MCRHHVFVFIFMLAQELPHYVQDIVLPSETNLRAQAIVHKGEMIPLTIKAFFDAEEQAALDAKRDELPEADFERQKNMMYGLAVDKGIKMGLGIDFNIFRPKNQLRPLADDEKRHLEFVDTPLLGNCKRSCITNVTTNRSRLEHPLQSQNDVIDEPTFYYSADRHCVGRALFDYYALGLKLRVVGQYDPWHIFEGFLKKSYAKCRMQYKRQEAAVVYRSFSGPYNSCAFWQSFKGCAKNFFKHAGPDCDEYVHIYPLICADRKISLEYQLDDDHRKQLWYSLPSSRCFQAMGFQPVLGRWGNFELKHTQYCNDESVILMILIRMGITLAWWPSAVKSPLFGLMNEFVDEEDDDIMPGLYEDPEDDEPAAPAAASSAIDPKQSVAKSVRQSNLELQKVRSTKVNTLDFACWHLADKDGRRQLDAAVCATEPLTNMYHQYLSSHKTLWGHHDFFLALSEGGLSAVIEEMWKLMSSPLTTKRLRLSPFPTLLVVDVEADKKTAQVLFDGILSISSELALYEYEFTHSLYGFSPRLLNQTDPAKLAQDLTITNWSCLFPHSSDRSCFVFYHEEAHIIFSNLSHYHGFPLATLRQERFLVSNLEPSAVFIVSLFSFPLILVI